MSLLALRAAASKEQKASNALVLHSAADRPLQSDDIAGAIARELQIAKLYELENSPRETVLKMLMTKKLEEHFTFKVHLGAGGNYVQAMRQVMSRVRKRAKKQKRPLQEFKLFEISIVHEVDHDVVTLMRSTCMTTKEESVYDAITDAFAKVQIIEQPKPLQIERK